MPKDYAKHVNKSKRPRVVHGWRKRLLLVGFLLLLCIVATFSIYIYQQYKSEVTEQAISGWIKQIKSLLITPKEQDVIKPIAELPVEEAKQEEDIQFSFYTNLSAMQVPAKQTPPPQPMATKPEILPVVTEARTAEKYLLQVAAFRNPTAAGEMRISLLLAGFEVEIVKALNNNQQLYQLQQGPFRTVAEAKSMQRELKNKGIESVIIKKIE